MSEIEEEISLIDLAIALGEEKFSLLAFPAFFGSISIAVSLWMTPIFTAKTVFLPPQQQQSSAASALANLGALAGLAGTAIGTKSPDEMYVAFLKTDSLRNALIEKFKLKDRYETKTLLDTRKSLEENVKVTSDKKSGLITVEVDDKDPQFAANLANAHLSELKSMLGRLAVTEAQQRRVFFEQQILSTQEALAVAEANFRTAKEASGMQVAAAIAEASVKASTELRAQIAAREVQLQALGRFATPQNPDLQRIGSELAALRTQLLKLEQGSKTESKATPTQQAALKAFREIKAREAMMGVLIAQLESARVDEAKEGPLLQLVDPASVPEKKSKPKRAIIVLVSVFAGLFLGILFAFARRAIRQTARDPERANELQKLKSAWRFL